MHTPVHASRLNEAEIYSSVVRCKLLPANDLVDLEALERRLLEFGRHYERIAKRSEWKSTRRDLDLLLGRLNDTAGQPVQLRAA